VDRELRLLHLSDIHYAGYGAWDLDADLRQQLITDLRGLVAAYGDLSGVLVGGDVARIASTDEFEDARQWLDQVCGVGGCRRSNVWTVPGNHDVDRTRIVASPMIESFQENLATCPIAEVDGELIRRIGGEAHRELLLSPFANYNDFALPYQCTTTADAVWWTDEETLRLGDRPVHLVGLNSALISSKRDDEMGAPCVVVGTSQAQKISRDSEAVSIVLCHHPPPWIRDWENVEPYFASRAHLLFFGHEHTFAVANSERQVQIFAGAVHPDRREEWVPAYNLVRLELSEHGDTFGVQVHARHYNPEDTCFGDAGTSPFTVTLVGATASGSAGRVEAVQTAAEEDGEPAELAAANITPARPNGKDIFFRYLDLPRTTRLAIADSLDLLSEEDRDLPDDQLFPLILRRADEARRVDDLDQEVTRVRP
jgi:hypothetical protein